MDSFVHLGLWTNWDYGKVHGLTLTVGKPWSDVLVAAIALVISFSATQIWGVVCFIVFRLRQSVVGDHVYHHVQAALRNSNINPTSFACQVLEIILSQRDHQRPQEVSTPPLATGLIRGFDNHAYTGSGHRHTATSEEHTGERAKGAFGSTFARLSWLLGLAAGFSVAFTAISVLGAQFFKAADDSALIASQYCGWPAEISDLDNVTTPEAKDTRALLMVPSRARIQRSRVYARTCYAEEDDAELSKQCDVFVTTRIASTLTIDETCPFPAARACKTDSARIDSGLIDSHDTLGINTPDEARVGVTKRLTCAPIDADQWATEWLDGAPWGHEKGNFIKAYGVGTLPGMEPPESEYPFVATKYSNIFATEPYPIWWHTFMTDNETASSFRPRDELKVMNADLTLVALSPVAFFDEEVPDPWFNITTRQRISPGIDSWRAPLGLTMLGCLEQYQFCASGFCSQPRGLYQLRSSSTYGLQSMTADQKAVADIVWKSLWAAQLQYALIFMGNEILVANEKVMGNWYMRSSKIPSNQWTIEAWNLANISFAVLQRRPGDYASPASVLRGAPGRLIQPETAAARALCQQIKIRTTRYSSFRVLSLALLAAVAVIVTTLNGMLPYSFLKVSSSAAGGRRKAAEWQWYNFFHLIRSMCEARGIGPWDRREKTVPTMRESQREFSLHAGGGGWGATADAGSGDEMISYEAAQLTGGEV